MNNEDLEKQYEEFTKGRLGVSWLPIFHAVSCQNGTDKWLFIKLSNFFEDIHTIAINSKKD